MTAPTALRKEKRPLQVRVHHLLPGLVLHPEHEAVPGDPRVIHQDMDLLVFRFDLVDDPLDFGRIGDAGRDALGGPARLADRLERPLQSVQRASHADHSRPARGQLHRDGPADPARRPGHQRDLTLQVNLTTHSSGGGCSLGHVRHILLMISHKTRPVQGSARPYLPDVNLPWISQNELELGYNRVRSNPSTPKPSQRESAVQLSGSSWNRAGPEGSFRRLGCRDRQGPQRGHSYSPSQDRLSGIVWQSGSRSGRGLGLSSSWSKAVFQSQATGGLGGPRVGAVGTIPAERKPDGRDFGFGHRGVDELQPVGSAGNRARVEGGPLGHRGGGSTIASPGPARRARLAAGSAPRTGRRSASARPAGWETP